MGHAASAWWGFTAADDRQRLEAVIRRGIRFRFLLSGSVSFIRVSVGGGRPFV